MRGLLFFGLHCRCAECWGCLMGWYLPCAERLRAQPNWSQLSLLALRSLKSSAYRRSNCSCFFQGVFQTSKVDEQLSNISQITSTSNASCHLYGLVWVCFEPVYDKQLLPLLDFSVRIYSNYFASVLSVSTFFSFVHFGEFTRLLFRNCPEAAWCIQNALSWGSLSKVQWILLSSKYIIDSYIWKLSLVLLKFTSIIKY